MNKIYEFGGVADVIIRCNSERTIGGIKYAEGEPYTCLKDVTVQLSYEQHAVETSGSKTVVSHRDGRPYQIIINNVPVTKKICNLILTSDKNEHTQTIKQVISCEQEGRLLLPQPAVNKPVYCYINEFDQIPVVLNMQTNELEGEFVVGQQYLVFYEIAIVGDSYSFEIPSYGWFSVEIYAKGNIDKTTNTAYMHFSAASLIAVPALNIINGGLFSTPLIFRLIYQNQPEPIIVFE